MYRVNIMWNLNKLLIIFNIIFTPIELQEVFLISYLVFILYSKRKSSGGIVTKSISII